MIQIDFTTKNTVPEYVTDKYGSKCLYDQNGKYHSYNDMPALIFPTGSKYWYKHGKLHRDNDFPAVINKSGAKWWCKNGKFHRDNNLPAVVSSCGHYGFFYENGKRLK